MKSRFCWLVSIVILLVSGCDGSGSPDPPPSTPGVLGYVRLVPSLPSMGRILGGSENYLYNASVNSGTPAGVKCNDLEDEIGLPMVEGLAGDRGGALAQTPWFRGVVVGFSYDDPGTRIGWDGGILVAQSPVTDVVDGTTYDFMSMVEDYPCQGWVDQGLIPADEVAAARTSHADRVTGAARVGGLPDDMVGYWVFQTPSMADPVLQTSAPLWTVGQRGLLDVYAQRDGYFVRVRLDGFAYDPSVSLVDLGRVVDLVRAVQDRVRENRYEVERDDSSPGTCHDVLSYMVEKDPSSISVTGCYCTPSGC